MSDHEAYDQVPSDAEEDYAKAEAAAATTATSATSPSPSEAPAEPDAPTAEEAIKAISKIVQQVGKKRRARREGEGPAPKTVKVGGKAKSAEEHPDRHIQYGAQLKVLTALTKAVAAEKIRRAKKAENPDAAPTKRAADVSRRELLQDDKVRAFYRLGRELLRELIEEDLREMNEEAAEELEEEEWERADLIEWCPGCQRFQDRSRHHHHRRDDDDEEGAPKAEA
ncbi:hypothetical protein L596_026000 [Steinernema carpocapsae]|uniref:Uncharacterized protein n=1 Tax=Steinernema carpocapsae TaxID=34508 RepID=A0A4U5M003_STECR|nr:hypothetical protein L596_026000 [Steinernema carpocapsae]